jgi:hypothetical protein
LSSAVANYAMGRAITVGSVLQGAAIGAVLGPGALVPSTAVGLGVGGLLAGGSLLPILTDPGASPQRKAAAAALIIASVYGAKAAFTYTRTVTTTTPPVELPPIRVSAAVRQYVAETRSEDSVLLIGFIEKSGGVRLFRAEPGEAHADFVAKGYISANEIAGGFAVGVRNGKVEALFPFSQYNIGRPNISIPRETAQMILDGLNAGDATIIGLK